MDTVMDGAAALMDTVMAPPPYSAAMGGGHSAGASLSEHHWSPSLAAEDHDSHAAHPAGAPSRKMRNPGEPTRPRVAQMFYAQHRKEEIRREGMAVSTVDLNAQCREEWKTLTDAQRMPFEHLERSDKERYDQEMLSYVPPPPVVPGIDASRFTKSGRLKKDPDRPKHPHSAYFYYMEANRPQVMSERAGASVPEITRALASGWKDLTDEGRQPYNDLAARDKERFANELQQYAPSAEFMAVQEQYARAKEQRRADKHAASLGVGPRDPMTQLLLAHGQEYPASADGMAGSSMAHSAQAAAVGYDAQAAAAAASLLDHDHQHVGLGMGGMVGGKRDASHLYAAHDDDDEDAVLLATPAADHEAAAAAAAAAGYDGEKKKRGRPKGSKNKPKDPDAPPRVKGPLLDEDGMPMPKRRPGRPKGSKNKPKDPAAMLAFQERQQQAHLAAAAAAPPIPTAADPALQGYGHSYGHGYGDVHQQTQSYLGEQHHQPGFVASAYPGAAPPPSGGGGGFVSVPSHGGVLMVCDDAGMGGSAPAHGGHELHGHTGHDPQPPGPVIQPPPAYHQQPAYQPSAYPGSMHPSHYGSTLEHDEAAAAAAATIDGFIGQPSDIGGHMMG